MPKQKWLRYVLIAMAFIALGYFRHILILHANVAATKNAFEFTQEQFPTLIAFFEQFESFLPTLEKLLQILFLAAHFGLSYYFLGWLGYTRPAKNQFITLWSIVALILFVASIAFSWFSLNQIAGLSRQLFVKLQSPMPFLIHYLLLKSKIF